MNKQNNANPGFPMIINKKAKTNHMLTTTLPSNSSANTTPTHQKHTV